MALRAINRHGIIYRTLKAQPVRMHSTLAHPPQHTKSPSSLDSTRTSPAPPHTSSAAPSLPIASLTLAHLPFTVLVRTLLTTLFTSAPLLMRPTLRVLSTIAYSPSPLLSPDHNPIVRSFLRQTLYRHFCAGENAAGVQRTLAQLRAQGIDGVVLGWAREIERRGADFEAGEHEMDDAAHDITVWREGTSRTVDMVPAGQFASVKCGAALSGSLGRTKLTVLTDSQAPAPI